MKIRMSNRQGVETRKEWKQLYMKCNGKRSSKSYASCLPPNGENYLLHYQLDQNSSNVVFINVHFIFIAFIFFKRDSSDDI